VYLPLLLVFCEELYCHLFPCLVQLLLLVWGEGLLVDSGEVALLHVCIPMWLLKGLGEGEGEEPMSINGLE